MKMISMILLFGILFISSVYAQWVRPNINSVCSITCEVNNSEPLFTASVANKITYGNITQWNNAGAGSSDGNYNVTSIQVTGTNTKTLNLEQNGQNNLTTTWTDMTAAASGNSTQEMIDAVNNTALNASNFKSIPCSQVVFTNGVIGASGICDGADSSGYNSLGDLQTAVSNDFHNLGGTDTDTFNSSAQMVFTVNQSGYIYYFSTLQATNINNSGNIANLGFYTITNIQTLFSTYRNKTDNSNLPSFNNISNNEMLQAIIGNKSIYNNISNAEMLQAIIGNKSVYNNISEAGMLAAITGNKSGYNNISAAELKQAINGNVSGIITPMNSTDIVNTSNVHGLNYTTLNGKYVAAGTKLGNSSAEIQAAELDAAHDTCAEITGCVVGAITGYTETDPQVGLLTNTNLCGANGTGINCNITAANCDAGQVSKFVGGVLTCVVDDTGVGISETSMYQAISGNLSTYRNFTDNTGLPIYNNISRTDLNQGFQQNLSTYRNYTDNTNLPVYNNGTLGSADNMTLRVVALESSNKTMFDSNATQGTLINNLITSNTSMDGRVDTLEGASYLANNSGVYNINISGWSSGTRLDQLQNPTISKEFTMSGNSLNFTWAGNGERGLQIEGTGNFNGDLVHIHQHTGNPLVSTDLLHLESAGVNVLGLNITTAATSGLSVQANQDIQARKFYGDWNGTSLFTGRLDSLENTNISIWSNINALLNSNITIWTFINNLVSSNTSQDTRLDALENTNSTLVLNLLNSNTTQNNLINNLVTSNTSQDTRLDNLESSNNTQDTRLDALENTNSTLILNLLNSNTTQNTLINNQVLAAGDSMSGDLDMNPNTLINLSTNGNVTFNQSCNGIFYNASGCMIMRVCGGGELVVCNT